MGKGSSAEALRIRREFLSDTYDEIILVELWLVLVRRWKTVAIVFSLCLVLGIVIALSTPTKFLFSTTIELALVNSKLVEPVASVLARLKGNHIPLVLGAEKGGDLFGVDVKNPRGSKILVLTSSGLAANAGAIKGLHRSILDLLIKDQRVLAEALDIPRKKKYSLLASQISIDTARISKLKQSEKLLANALVALGGNAISPQEGGIDLLQAQALNAHALVGAEHAMIDYQSRLFELKSAIELSRQATAAAIAVRSLTPSGIGAMATILLAAMMGLFVGVLAAFFQEFIAKVRCSMRSAE